MDFKIIEEIIAGMSRVGVVLEKPIDDCGDIYISVPENIKNIPGHDSISGKQLAGKLSEMIDFFTGSKTTTVHFKRRKDESIIL